MKRIFFVLILCLFFLFPPQVHADSNFATSLSGAYAVNTSGITHAVFTVTLKNVSDRYYASYYTIQLGFRHIANITASDIDGAIVPKIKQTKAGDELTFAFNHRAIGLGAVQSLRFSFDTTDVASKDGSIWEVNIPGLKDANQFENFSVNVIVPSSFGSLTYEKPNIGNTLIFTKDQLGESGISLAFGNKQVYHFNLSYHLKNNQLFPVRTEIALPPDTSYQQISIDSLDPRPLNVRRDNDGNWMALYSLNPGQVLTVHANGRALISLNPQEEVLSRIQFENYLKPTAYWQSNDTKIIALAKQLRDPYSIYEYVVKTLRYDYPRVNDNQERLGAIAVLEHPTSAVCLEFTDLFIALARAAGIPAREVDGYAYTNNSSQRPLSLQKDILHAWPEYYDKDTHTWIMVDPTWENTTGGVDYFHTFDFDHIAFVVKGKSPDYPVPAGGYKLSGDKQEEVAVDFASDTVLPDPISSFDFTLPAIKMGGFAVTGDLIIHNTGSVAFPPHTLRVDATLAAFAPQELSLPEIPPFANVDIPITLGKTAFLTNQTGTVTISLAQERVSRKISIVPFSQLGIILVIGGVLIGSFVISLFIFARRSRRVPVSG